MINLALARKAVLAIGWLTMVSGATQVVVPGFVLGFLNAEVSPASSHFFGIVGMFMVLFGGLLVHALRASAEQFQTPLLWCALQKFGASAAVGLGVGRGVFSALALGVAGFDLLSGILILAYRKRAKG